MATALLASLSAPVALSASNAQAKSVQTLREEAQQILNQINANGDRISTLDEQINDAHIKLGTLHTQIHQTELQIASAQHTIGALHSAVVARAAALYEGAGGANDFSESAASVQQQGAMSVYSQAAAAQDQQRIDKYRNARDARTRAKAQLDAAEKSETQQLNSLESNEHQIVRLNEQEESLYHQKNAELQNAIVQAQKAQEEAAQAAAARKAREAQAAARAATVQRSSGGGGGGSNAATVVATPAPAPSAGAATAVNVAMSKIGDPYVFAASGPSTFDCSGLTMFAWSAAGVGLPHSADGQYRMLPSVPIGDAQPGDLAFFGTTSYVHHVGMVIGNGMMVEAPFTGADVRTSSYITRRDLVGIGRP
ncbi:MAG TPA: NlpC/P60 family protein [Acidimicrobiia bacterium]